MKATAFDRRAIPASARLSTWSARDGWELRRLDHPQPAGVAPRGSLIFAGGRGDFIEKYLEPLAHWYARGWNVTSFDWRGQGGSRGSIVGGNFTDFNPLVGDCADLIQAWRAGTPGPHVAIGHSMGGHLLLRAIAERQTRLDAAVLVAPMLGINTGRASPRLLRWTVRLIALLGGRDRRSWKETSPGTTTGRIRRANLTSCEERYHDELWWKEREPGLHLGAPSWGWLDGAFRSTSNHTPEALRKVLTPILILATPRDRLVSPAAILRAAGLLPNAELAMFPQAAHEILRERDPIRLEALARVDAFLDEHALG